MSLKSGSEKSNIINIDKESEKKMMSLINKINQILLIVLEENKNSSNYKDKLLSQKDMPLTSSFIPSITIKKYLERIINYTEAEESTFIIALIYIDRLNNISKVILTPNNIHRIIFVAILLAIKYNEDSTYEFEHYAQVAGVSVNELKVLEFEFVCLMQFNLFINKKDYDNYKVYLDEIDSEEED